MKMVDVPFHVFLIIFKYFKIWLDLVYGVNVGPIPPKAGLQIIHMLAKLGHYKLPDGKDDFECTSGMIDTIAENIKANIGEMSIFGKDAVFLEGTKPLYKI